jgi:hypothetical protein
MYAYEELVSVGRRLHVGHVLSARELVGVRGEVVSLPSEGELVHLQLRRFAGCPVCNLHLRSFAMRRDEIAKFNARARNPSGARGLMQLMPVTSKAMAKRLGRKHAPMDPDFSIHAGTKLLAQLTEKYEGDEELALFGYARGIGSVANWRETPGQPMPEGVQSFIRKVRRAQAKFSELGFPDAAKRPSVSSR